MKNTRKHFGDTIIKKEDSKEEESNSFKIEYYEIESSISEAEYLNQYGLEIVKRNIKDGEIVERKGIMDITKSEEKINNLLDILHRNKVTPISLIDIIEDLQYMGFLENK